MATDSGKFVLPAITLVFGMAAGWYFASKDTPPTLRAEPCLRPLAFFDTTQLNTPLSVSGCSALRFYNARRSADDAEGTALMIPVDSDGKELYDEAARVQYVRFKELGGSLTVVDMLTTDQANEALNWVREGGGHCVAVAFEKSDLRTMLAVDGCNGIRLNWRMLTLGKTTMEAGPVKIDAGSATAVGTDMDVLVCSEPCPSFCGDQHTANYLVME